MTKTNVKRKLTEFHWFDFKIAKHKMRPFAFFGVRNFIDHVLGEVVHFKLTPLTRPAEWRGNGTAGKGAGMLDGDAGNDWRNEEWRAAA